MDIAKACKLLDDFFSAGKKLEFARRDPIIHYGMNTDVVYWIASGAVKVYGYSETGNETIHYLYKAHEMFPIVKFFNRLEQYEIGYSAFIRSEVFAMPAEAVNKFLNDQPYALVALMQQEAEAYDRILCLSTSPAELRVGRRALTLARRFGRQVGDHYVIDLPFTVQEFADSIKLSRETTGKAIRMFELEGAIIMGKQSIILYPEALEEACAKIANKQHQIKV